MRAHRSLQVELLISHVLRWGIILCSIVIALGLTARLAHLGLSPTGSIPGTQSSSSSTMIQELREGRVFRENPVPTSVLALTGGLARAEPDVIMAVGLMLLILLPIVRVGLTVVLFLIEEDWPFLGITLFVFCVLMTGIILGRSV